MKKRVKPKHPSCREHSCDRPRVGGYCKKHQDPKDRHHDKRTARTGVAQARASLR